MIKNEPFKEPPAGHFHLQRRRKQGTSECYNYTFIADKPIRLNQARRDFS
jgi:hypothetical protein